MEYPSAFFANDIVAVAETKGMEAVLEIIEYDQMNG